MVSIRDNCHRSVATHLTVRGPKLCSEQEIQGCCPTCFKLVIALLQNFFIDLAIKYLIVLLEYINLLSGWQSKTSIWVDLGIHATVVRLSANQNGYSWSAHTLS